MFRRVFLAMLTCAALPLGATTTYTSLSSMTSANPSLTFTNVDFSGLAGLTPAPSLTTSGVTFAASSGDLSWAATMSGWGAGNILKTVNTPGTIVITLPGTATAFGGYFGFTGSSTATVTLSGAGDTSFSVNASVTQNTPQYWGVVSTVAFTSISVSMAGSTKVAAINSFTFGTPSGGGGGGEVPEPSTLALIGSGLIAFPLIARRRRNRQAGVR